MRMLVLALACSLLLTTSCAVFGALEDDEFGENQDSIPSPLHNEGRGGDV